MFIWTFRRILMSFHVSHIKFEAISNPEIWSKSTLPPAQKLRSKFTNIFFQRRFSFFFSIYLFFPSNFEYNSCITLPIAFRIKNSNFRISVKKRNRVFGKSKNRRQMKPTPIDRGSQKEAFWYLKHGFWNKKFEVKNLKKRIQKLHESFRTKTFGCILGRVTIFWCQN